MLLACPLIVAGLFCPNPLSVTVLPETRQAQFDPIRPGLLALSRHPVLFGFALWAGSHLAPNGDIGSMFLFGGLLVFSLGGMRMLDRRHQRRLGYDRWHQLAARTSLWPGSAWISGRAPFIWHTHAWRDLPWKTLGAGLILYPALIALHPWVIGLPAWPGFWFGR
jgi:uncharacterized membrane protein